MVFGREYDCGPEINEFDAQVGGYDNVFVFNVSMHDVEGCVEVIHRIDDLPENMSGLGFGEFGLCFNTFEEIVRWSTNHEWSGGTSEQGCPSRYIHSVHVGS